MSSVLAIIPARIGSKGIPRKNWTSLAGKTPLRRAVDCARDVRGIESIVVTTDAARVIPQDTGVLRVTILHASAPLHTDECPMIDVITDVLERVPGPEDQIVVLLQPTQPLRKPEHVTKAIELLREEQISKQHSPGLFIGGRVVAPVPAGPDIRWHWSSVVSVVELPRTHHPAWQYEVGSRGELWSYPVEHDDVPTRRQDLEPTFIRDGTCYVFWRRTVTEWGNIYGRSSRAMIIPASETCSLDTLDDWAEAERRLKARE